MDILQRLKSLLSPHLCGLAVILRSLPDDPKALSAAQRTQITVTRYLILGFGKRLALGYEAMPIVVHPFGFGVVLYLDHWQRDEARSPTYLLGLLLPILQNTAAADPPPNQRRCWNVVLLWVYTVAAMTALTISEHHEVLTVGLRDVMEALAVRTLDSWTWYLQLIAWSDRFDRYLPTLLGIS